MTTQVLLPSSLGDTVCWWRLGAQWQWQGVRRRWPVGTCVRWASGALRPGAARRSGTTVAVAERLPLEWIAAIGSWHIRGKSVNALGAHQAVANRVPPRLPHPPLPQTWWLQAVIGSWQLRSSNFLWLLGAHLLQEKSGKGSGQGATHPPPLGDDRLQMHAAAAARGFRNA